jgi:hypothetical protein
VIAVDGKTLCGSAHDGEGGHHLLAALDQAHGVVLGQVEVGAKTNEIPMFTALLDRLDIQDAVITAVARGLAFPHAAQAIQIVRRRKMKGKWSAETCYATSPSITQAVALVLGQPSPVTRSAHGRSLEQAAPSVSGLFQLEWVTFLLIIKLPHKLNEHMLQLCQPLPTPILQVLKIMFEGSEPFLHG